MKKENLFKTRRELKSLIRKHGKLFELQSQLAAVEQDLSTPKSQAQPKHLKPVFFPT